MVQNTVDLEEEDLLHGDFDNLSGANVIKLLQERLLIFL